MLLGIVLSQVGLWDQLLKQKSEHGRLSYRRVFTDLLSYKESPHKAADLAGCGNLISVAKARIRS